MGIVSVSSRRCCMFVSCVHPVAVLNAVFWMTCSLLMLVEDAIGEMVKTFIIQQMYRLCRFNLKTNYNFF